VVSIEHLTKSFRGVDVLRDVSLTFGRGERVALVGANGAGKTTLVRCLLGEYRHQGRIAVDGRSPRAARLAVLRRVGFVPQLPPPLKMPVGELLRFAASLCGAPVSDLESVAQQLGLDTEQVRGQSFGKLSGGQKQKLLIAVALGRETNLLVLDEPAANLDPEARHRFFGLLAERAADATLLLSSHRLDEVAPLVDRVIELDRGRVALDDRVADGRDTAPLQCRLVLVRDEPGMAAALRDWGFAGDAADREFTGTVPGADRLRFLAMLSRYSGAVDRVQLERAGNAG
jgi:ABC-2 type transport system ATP-binding protein